MGSTCRGCGLYWSSLPPGGSCPACDGVLASISDAPAPVAAGSLERIEGTVLLARAERELVESGLLDEQSLLARPEEARREEAQQMRRHAREQRERALRMREETAARVEALATTLDGLRSRPLSERQRSALEHAERLLEHVRRLNRPG